ncbi:ATP-binding cassette domain-containing protein [Nesterenkonia pannonica]|uniref:ATP-binding cassette domain-containing protein n=1 Tax=Nesterenkonia pannonica TaxID=1548602 RepID=UPI002164C708|nr:ATP-binding cassette domain-containing protein [Nesterenkonia pannonica]
MQEKVEDSLATVGISDLIDQYPGQLSGGQQQRTALARALVDGSRVVLFDEPLSNVDAQVREQLRIELLATQRRLGFTAIFVTHDQAEAMELATRIAVLDQERSSSSARRRRSTAAPRPNMSPPSSARRTGWPVRGIPRRGVPHVAWADPSGDGLAHAEAGQPAVAA